MNKREFLIGSIAVAAASPFAALAKPTTDEGEFEARVSNDSGLTYSTATGTYRRIGNKVEFSIPSLPSPGASISGLPFAAS